MLGLIRQLKKKKKPRHLPHSVRELLAFLRPRETSMIIWNMCFTEEVKTTNVFGVSLRSENRAICGWNHAILPWIRCVRNRRCLWISNYRFKSSCHKLVWQTPFLWKWVDSNIGSLFYTQRVLGSPKGKHCKSLREYIWWEIISTSKQRFLRDIISAS